MNDLAGRRTCHWVTCKRVVCLRTGAHVSGNCTKRQVLWDPARSRAVCAVACFQRFYCSGILWPLACAAVSFPPHSRSSRDFSRGSVNRACLVRELQAILVEAISGGKKTKTLVVAYVTRICCRLHLIIYLVGRPLARLLAAFGSALQNVYPVLAE